MPVEDQPEQELFNRGSMEQMLSGQIARTHQYFLELKEEDFLKREGAELAQEIFELYSLRNIPMLAAPESSSQDVASTRGPLAEPDFKFTLRWTFEADMTWFFMGVEANLLGGVKRGVRARVAEKELMLTYVRPRDYDPVRLKNEMDRDVESIRAHIDYISRTAAELNPKLLEAVTTQVRQRQERISERQKLAEFLTFPLARKQDTAALVPLVKRTVRLKELPAKTNPPEFSVADDDYEQIVRLLRLMSETMEKYPPMFREMEEEVLRFFFLTVLNSTYEGQATGETFNSAGKTDILIQKEEKTLFIAECKFWRGEQSFHEALDQLLNYLCWRNTKAAILIFNRNKNFTSVLNKIDETAQKHPHWKQSLGKEDESQFRYVFTQQNDPDRSIYLTVLAFDIPPAQ
jgi:hypothetical protein